MTCRKCRTIYEGSPGDVCPNCPEEIPASERGCSACGGWTTSTCLDHDCDNPLCRECSNKSEFACCPTCEAKKLDAETREAKQDRMGNDLGSAMFDLGATLMRMQASANRFK